MTKCVYGCNTVSKALPMHFQNNLLERANSIHSEYTYYG